MADVGSAGLGSLTTDEIRAVQQLRAQNNLQQPVQHPQSQVISSEEWQLIQDHRQKQKPSQKPFLPELHLIAAQIIAAQNWVAIMILRDLRYELNERATDVEVEEFPSVAISLIDWKLSLLRNCDGEAIEKERSKDPGTGGCVSDGETQAGS